MNFSDLQGKTLVSIKGGEGDEVIYFTTTEGEEYRLIYHQHCCASCCIEDIVGDLADLIGNPILVAEEVNDDGDGSLSEYDESYTWTYYKLNTIKGGVTIRWYGSSNGYYSEKATFEKLIEGNWTWKW